jgi:hypothetical protein
MGVQHGFGLLSFHVFVIQRKIDIRRHNGSKELVNLSWYCYFKEFTLQVWVLVSAWLPRLPAWLYHVMVSFLFDLVEEATCNVRTCQSDMRFFARFMILCNVGGKEGAAAGGRFTAAATVASFSHLSFGRWT